MDSLKDVTKKNNIETKKALMNMEKKIDKLSRATKATPASSVSSTGPVSSPKTSSKPSKAKEQPSKPSKEKPAKKEGKSLTEYQKKQRFLLIGDSIAHNTNFRVVEEATNTTIKTSKAKFCLG